MVAKAAADGIPPRPIPWSVLSRRVVVTYSDGEAADVGVGVGVGVAIWTSGFNRPHAGRLLVHDVVRKAWSSSRCSLADPIYDIKEIEGIGPLTALAS